MARGPLRISVSGAARTGKTTLATLLSKRLGIPLIPEVARELFESGHQLGQRATVGTQELIAIYQCQRQANVSSFVSDRSLVDVVGYCSALADHATGNEKLGYLSVMKSSSRLLLNDPPSHVIIPEERFLSPVSDDEDRFQRKVHAKIVEVVGQAGWLTLTVTGPLENRCEEAVHWIRTATYPL
jgi:hypothetical protein